jgi:hypothetical protein
LAFDDENAIMVPFCDKAIAGIRRATTRSRHAIDFLPFISTLLELNLYDDATERNCAETVSIDSMRNPSYYVVFS